ncbi:hypothetical protein MBH78_20390 [Oceanimonas sp. NS1]|nr:hypothetical protein [Oceanimonas sp. NS1]
MLGLENLVTEIKFLIFVLTTQKIAHMLLNMKSLMTEMVAMVAMVAMVSQPQTQTQA